MTELQITVGCNIQPVCMFSQRNPYHTNARDRYIAENNVTLTHNIEFPLKKYTFVTLVVHISIHKLSQMCYAVVGRK